MVDAGDIPVPVPGSPVPIPLSTLEHAKTEIFSMVGRFFGGGLTAGILHDELEPVMNSDQLDNIRSTLHKTASYVQGPLVTELNSIKSDLHEAYKGAATSAIDAQFEGATTTCGELAPKFTSLSGTVNHTQDTLNTCWQAVKGYSRFGSDVSNVTSLVGGESDDDKADDAWNQAKGSLQGLGNNAAGVGGGTGWDNRQGEASPVVTQPPQATIPDAGATGPGPGNFGPGPGTVLGPGPHGPGPHGPGPQGPGPVGPGPTGPGPGYGGPGPGYGGPGPGYGGPGPGYGGPGYGGPGPGSGLDTGSDLSSAGPGPGYGGPGPGPGPGFGGDSASGLSGAGGPGAGSGAAAAGEAGAGGQGGVGALPLGGRGGGGGGGGDSDRERSTWLTEDDDVWGESDAPDGTIT